MAKALVVEGNPLCMELVVELLTASGFTAETAIHGEMAIKKAENDDYDLIIINPAIPCMDGITTTKIIKSKPGYEDIPVIALTAYAMKGDRERFLAEGFNEYVSKPVNVADFMNILKKYKK